MERSLDVAADDNVCDFVPLPLHEIPPVIVQEYRTIFADIDWTNKGSISQEDLRVAFLVNDIDLPVARVNLMLTAMERLSGGRDITFEPACRCLYSVSLLHREVRGSATYSVFPDSMFTAETATGSLRLRRAIWLLLDDPMSSGAARLIALTIVLTILLSTISFCVETLPGVHNKHTSMFDDIETVTVTLFTIEFLLRLTCTPELRRFLSSALNVIDLLAIVPFYIEMVLISTGNTSDMSGSAMLRAVRLIRVFRLVKIGRYLQWMRVFGQTLARSVAPLLMLLFILSLALLLFSSAAYFIERGTWDTELNLFVVTDSDGNVVPSNFGSIPMTVWWGIITMTAVGYGDVVPTSQFGKGVAAICFFVGIMISAIPISIISGNFHAEYAHMKRIKALKVAHMEQPPPQPVTASPEFRARHAKMDAEKSTSDFSLGPAEHIGAGAGLTLPMDGQAISMPLDLTRSDRHDNKLLSGSATADIDNTALMPDTWRTEEIGSSNEPKQSNEDKDVKIEGENDDDSEDDVVEPEEGDTFPTDSEDTSMHSPQSRSQHRGRVRDAPPLLLPSTPSAYDILAASRAARAAEALEARAAARMEERGSGSMYARSAHASTAEEAEGSVDADLARAAALRAVALMTIGNIEEEVKELSPTERILEQQNRIDASWSEPFLRTALQVVRNSRRSLMSSLKSAELKSRDLINDDLKDFLSDVPCVGTARAASVVQRASKTGLV